MGISTVKKNIIANFAGSGWSALLALALIPVYVKFLGIEAWGVVGIFTSLQTLAYLLDLGLSTTLNREMARLSLQQDTAQEMRDLVRTFELIYWGVALVIGVSLFALAPVIAHRWLRGDQIATESIANALRLMAVAITLQLPFALYAGALMGLQRQVLLNAINVSIATFRGVGAFLVLALVSSTLPAFFLWQIIAAFVQIGLVRFFLNHSLPHTGSRSSFQREALRTRWRFAAGLSGAVIMTIVLSQMDKVILSRLLSLQFFGYYVLAASVAANIQLLVVPVVYALYPRFTQLVALEDQEGLKEIYHHGSQLMSIMIIPTTCILSLFSQQILRVWIGDSVTVENTFLVLSILIVNGAITGLMNLPIALQLAYGWTKLVLYINIVAALVLVPSLILVAGRYGTVGAALTLVAVSAAAAFVNIQMMHHRLLKGEQWRWYLVDVGLPLSVALGAAILCKVVLPLEMPRFQLLVSLAAVSCFVFGATVMATPVSRDFVLTFLRTWQGRILKTS